MSPWLEVTRGTAPLIVTIPHSGSEIPSELEEKLVSPWLARKDTDWWVERLYGFAAGLGATVIRTRLSRTVIDLNRDPSGASLYPGQATTTLCPTTSFDGEPLYQPGCEPDPDEIARRHALYFVPYHAAIRAELGRLRQDHRPIVVYDAHSIRSEVPRLFDGLLPHLNIGSNHDRTCDGALTDAIARLCAASPFSHVANGRFVGGWSTRHYGAPDAGIHAIQMELACRAYLIESDSITPASWPPAFDATFAAPLGDLLAEILCTCLNFTGDFNDAHRQ